MRALSLPANYPAGGAGSLSQHRRTGHTMGYVLTISAFATIINIVLVSGGLAQGHVSPPERPLKFPREDVEMWFTSEKEWSRGRDKNICGHE